MADVQVIISQAGPLPIKATAEIESDGPSVLTLAGSVWTEEPNSIIGFTLFLDGQPTMIGAEIFANAAGTHMSVVPVIVPYTFTIGSHTFALQPVSSMTTSDSNDRFYLTVQY